MWGSLLALGLLLSLHPLRLGVTLLVISRSRPMQNLFVYWLGSLTVCFVLLIVPLFLLHFVPAFSSVTSHADLTTNPTARHVGLGLGILSLMVAALIALRSTTGMRRYASASHRIKGPGNPRRGEARTQVLDDEPNPISKLLSPADDPTTGDRFRTRRLAKRIRDAWEGGALWVSFVIGLAMGPSADGVLFVLAIIVASGHSIGLQVGAAVTFILAMLAVEEVVLVSNLAAPRRTQAFLRQLHNWAHAHRRKVMIAIFAVVGISLIAQGIVSG
ncbi:hypothetical protein BVU76_26495 [Mycolicibacterium porcinum]|nr:hypothetical protein BVU76_26495 [Mycolicibacterium porcinum]